MGYSPWGHKESDTTERLTCSLQAIPSPGFLPYLIFSTSTWSAGSHNDLNTAKNQKTNRKVSCQPKCCHKIHAPKVPDSEASLPGLKQLL